MKSTERKKTIIWQDPAINTRDVPNMSGLEYLELITNKKLAPPPVANLIGYKILAVKNGSAVYELDPEEYHYNPFSSVHGGIISTLLDTAMTASVLTTLARGVSCSTVEIKVNFVRPVTSGGGTFRCEAQVLHMGKSLATAEGKLTDRDGRLYAHGTTTCSIFKSKAG